jgi:hypothetical protein
MAVVSDAERVVAPDTDQDMYEAPAFVTEVDRRQYTHTRAAVPVVKVTTGPGVARNAYEVEAVDSDGMTLSTADLRSTI